MTTPAVPYHRTHAHTRTVTCTGYARSDGLWDVDGRLIDTKPYRVRMPDHSILAGEPIHDMTLRISFDGEMVIHAVTAHMEHHPYDVCPEIESAYQRLVGMRIEAGFSLRVKGIFRGVAGCSHLTELIGPMATTAYQMIWSDHPDSQFDPNPEVAAPKTTASPLGGCHALSKSGKVVKIYFPDQYEGADEAPAT